MILDYLLTLPRVLDYLRANFLVATHIAVFILFMLGLGYVVIAVTLLVSGKIEAFPTQVTVAELEAGAGLDARYLRVTGGRLLLPEAEGHRWNEETEWRTVFVPVVSERLMREWADAREAGEAFDASRVRLMARIEPPRLAETWPQAWDEAAGRGRSDATVVPAELQGEAQFGPEIVVRPRGFKERARGFDWDYVWLLEYEKHFFSPMTVLMHMAKGLPLVIFTGVVFVRLQR